MADADERSTFHHSSSYHKFFKNYYEERVPHNNKKGYKIKRVYIGPIIVRKGSDSAWYGRKVGYLLLSLLSLGLFTFCGLNNADFNRSWYVALPGFVSFLGALILCFECIDFASKPRKMTEYDYNSGPKRLLSCSFFLPFPLALEALMIALYMILNPAGRTEALSGLLLVLIAIIPPVLIWVTEKKAEYDFLENPAKPIGDGAIIE